MFLKDKNGIVINTQYIVDFYGKNEPGVSDREIVEVSLINGNTIFFDFEYNDLCKLLGVKE